MTFVLTIPGMFGAGSSAYDEVQFRRVWPSIRDRVVAGGASVSVGGTTYAVAVLDEIIGWTPPPPKPARKPPRDALAWGVPPGSNLNGKLRTQ